MTLDEQYQKTIDDQRSYLLKLQEDFNKVCEEAKESAQKKLKEIPKDDKESREAVLQEEKGALQTALHTLKTEIDRSTKETMRKLEEIVRIKEAKILAKLEEEIEAL